MSQKGLFKRIARLKVPVPDLADGCHGAGYRGRVTNQTLRPAVPFFRLAGTAITVREYLDDGPCDYSQQIAKVYDMGRSVHRAVLVIRNEVPGFACMGSGGVRVARYHGYVGCVVDGAIRDTQELAEVGFPLFGTMISPYSIMVEDPAPGKSIHFEFGAPVEIAGIKIAQGDIVVADNDALIAIEPDKLEDILVKAENIEKSDDRLFAYLKKGKTYSDFLAEEAGNGKPPKKPKASAGKGGKRR